MGFLDNSGDIILDAVLTDLGRERLARGDGSFKITKFALGDDEINYGNYNKNHASGSAYYDLEVLQTPVFEAFTNNTSVMQSRLMSLSRNDILYLPVIKINKRNSNAKTNGTEGKYIVAVDETTEDLMIDGDSSITGVFYTTQDDQNEIELDQGIDNSEYSPSRGLASDLRETQYMIEIDNRLGTIYDAAGSSAASVSFIDDDNVAFYYLTTSDTDYVEDISSLTGGKDSVLPGARGSRLSFKIKGTLDLQTGTSLFTRLGDSEGSIAGVTGPFYTINSTVRVTGVTTGYRIDLPIKFIKKQ